MKLRLDFSEDLTNLEAFVPCAETLQDIEAQWPDDDDGQSGDDGAAALTAARPR